MVPGWDMAGTVTSVGEGVNGLQVGDRVAAMTFQPLDQNGTYRSLMDLPAELLAAVPSEVNLQTAASIPLVGLTGAQICGPESRSSYSNTFSAHVNPWALLAGARQSRRLSGVETVLQRRRRLSASEIDRFVERYAELRSLRLVALEFKTDRSTAPGHLRERHVELASPPSMKRDEVTAAIGLYAEGKSSAAIGGALGFTNKTVVKELRSWRQNPLAGEQAWLMRRAETSDLRASRACRGYGIPTHVACVALRILRNIALIRYFPVLLVYWRDGMTAQPKLRTALRPRRVGF